jgi:cytoskeletal protein RodZ
MQKIGSYLKQIREERKLSLKTINDKTKIRIDYLEDIENNTFKILDNYGVARVIVCSYGKALNAPEKEVLYLFDETYPHEHSHTFSPQKDIKEKKILISFNLLYIVGISALVLIITFSLINLYKNGSFGSPFRKNILVTEEPQQPDSLKATPEVVEEKVDEKHEMMKQLVENNEKANVPVAVDQDKAVFDNTDYSKDLIFKNKDSVLETD